MHRYVLKTPSPAERRGHKRNAAIVFGFIVTACGGSDSTVPGATLLPPNDGGISVPVSCDLAADAMNAPACVVEDVGIFVDGEGGDDSGPGTRANAVKSIHAAIAKLAGRPRIYICGDGRFDETVRFDASTSASLYGGYACSDWRYVGSRPTIAPSMAGYVLQVSSANGDLTVSDLALTARDGEVAGTSSIAVFAANSGGITFRRVVVTAGVAAAGWTGAPLTEYATPAPPGRSGAMNGRSTANPLCPASVGAGGDAPAQPTISPPYPLAYTGAAGSSANDRCTAGVPGSFGVGGSASPAAAASGTIDETGWKGADGLVGGSGGHGQGGGNGGAWLQVDGGDPTPIPGGGGAGGCGGRGGNFGQAGGSSIAILSLNTPIALDHARLIASNAGAGGSGSKGQKGQLASSTIAPPASFACSGAVGGVGGSGAGGGGGAGGVSVGILYAGAAPVVDGTATASADTSASVTLGKPGAGGAGGAASEPAQSTGAVSRGGERGLDGVSGFTKAVATLP